MREPNFWKRIFKLSFYTRRCARIGEFFVNNIFYMSLFVKSIICQSMFIYFM